MLCKWVCVLTVLAAMRLLQWVAVELLLTQLLSAGRKDSEGNGIRDGRHLYPVYGVPICQQCACGVSNLRDSERIVGGEEPPRNAYPWMALITGNNTPACGGAVISDQYVATAAHCTTLRYRQEELKVVLGEHNHCEPDNRTSSFSVLRMIVHPLFNASTYAFDIMLLKLSMRLTFNEIVRPICLPQWGQLVSTPLREQEGTALGWGVLAFQSPFKTCELRQVELLLIPRAQCLVQSSYTPEMLPPTLFCAGFPQGGKDSCQGDSGGPLQVMNSQGRYELLGIISNGISCAHPAFPGKYTNVPLFTAWIIANTQDSNYCTN